MAWKCLLWLSLELAKEIIWIPALEIVTIITLLLICLMGCTCRRRCMEPLRHDYQAAQRPHSPPPFSPDGDVISMHTLNLSEGTNTDAYQFPEQYSSPLRQSNNNPSASSQATDLQVVTPEISSSASSPLSLPMHISSTDSRITQSSYSSHTPLLQDDHNVNDDTAQPHRYLTLFGQEG